MKKKYGCIEKDFGIEFETLPGPLFDRDNLILPIYDAITGKLTSMAEHNRRIRKPGRNDRNKVYFLILSHYAGDDKELETNLYIRYKQEIDLYEEYRADPSIKLKYEAKAAKAAKAIAAATTIQRIARRYIARNVLTRVAANKAVATKAAATKAASPSGGTNWLDEPLRGRSWADDDDD
jgi:hypothetical protein